MYRMAILGATGLVGREMPRILADRKFPLESIKFLASERSTGITIPWMNSEYPVEIAHPDVFEDIDLVLSSAGEAISRELTPTAVGAGAIVIDNTAEFRMCDDVPLVIPEINPDDARKHKGIIANPNCSTVIVLMALAPLRILGTFERIIVSTYQSTSGAGTEAIGEMEDQIRAEMESPPRVFTKPIAFNAIPAIGSFRDDGYTSEEAKMTFESRKILGIPDLPITCTCVRVPVRVGHAASVNVVFGKPVDLQDVRTVLRDAPGVELHDNPSQHEYPTPLDCAGRDVILVGRVRGDISHPRGVNFWVVGDNLRKGAALNAVQIAELIARS